MLRHICRSPHGERGLKYVTLDGEVIAVKSLPARGAWIEMRGQAAKPHALECRSPHGERGLKYCKAYELVGISDRRSPHGERGLKY